MKRHYTQCVSTDWQGGVEIRDKHNYDKKGDCVICGHCIGDDLKGLNICTKKELRKWLDKKNEREKEIFLHNHEIVIINGNKILIR